MNFADLLARFRRPRPFDWAQTDLAHEPPSGFKIVADPLAAFREKAVKARRLAGTTVGDMWWDGDEVRIWDGTVWQPLIQFPGAGNDELLTDYEGEPMNLTRKLEPKTCPKLGGESEHILRDVLQVQGTRADAVDRTVEMIEEMRQVAYQLGYAAGHYNALEESIP